ncbi:MAG: hypothetical protein ACFFAO_05340 [Candidatus Hermodarchaeota archaeon]
MKETNIIIDRPRGFAGLIANIMEPLNDNPDFKKTFRKSKRKILINASNLDFAALLTIDHGTLKVQSVPNKPKSNLKKKTTGWDGFVSMDTMTFLAFAMKRISILKISSMMLTGKVKMRGLLKLIPMLKLFKILSS